MCRSHATRGRHVDRCQPSRGDRPGRGGPRLPRHPRRGQGRAGGLHRHPCRHRARQRRNHRAAGDARTVDPSLLRHLPVPGTTADARAVGRYRRDWLITVAPSSSGAYADRMPVCAACRQDNPDIARFCLTCGARLTPAAPAQEERRVITAIFVDLVGSTSRAEMSDPEDVRAMLSLYYDRVRADIESFGGVVEKFIGDAVLGLFGAPTSHGDAPERAVRAAFAVLDGVADLNERNPGLDLQTRIAVNTGEALVTMSPEPGQAMAVGDVLNTASRLQNHAPVDGIVVGEETFACTRDSVQYEQMPAFTAKGKAEPVRAWRAIAALHPPRDRAQSGVPLVARERELRMLRESWDRAVLDRSLQLVTVFGPSGIGKTRLGAEFMTLVSDAGGRPGLGRLAPHRGAPDHRGPLPYRDSGPYGAFASRVKRLVGTFENDPRPVSAEKLRSAIAG